MTGRRGLSDVVTVILIVLITITAVAFIANLIIPFVSKNLQSSSECVNARGYFTFDDSQGFDCYDNSRLYGFSVKGGNSNIPDASANLSIAGFAVVFSNPGSNNVNVRVLAGNSTSSAAGGIRMLNSSISKASIPGTNEVQTFVYNSGNTVYAQADIYPILSSGRLCDKSATINFKPCGSGVTLTP